MKTFFLFFLFLTCDGLLFCKQGQTYCLKDCQQTNTSLALPLKASTQTATTVDNSNNVGTRNKSHNMGDVKNSIVGDVTIQNGHTKMEISNVQKGSSIDASINSSVVLGDIHQ